LSLPPNSALEEGVMTTVEASVPRGMAAKEEREDEKKAEVRERVESFWRRKKKVREHRGPLVIFS